MSSNSNLWERLRNEEYRRAFIGSQINIGIPFQIKALLKSRHWTQRDLAKQTGMLQPRISSLLTPGKTRPNIETLRRIADAFDCGLIVRFAPFSELSKWSNDFDPEAFCIPSFEEEERKLTVPNDALPETGSMAESRRANNGVQERVVRIDSSPRFEANLPRRDDSPMFEARFGGQR